MAALMGFSMAAYSMTNDAAGGSSGAASAENPRFPPLTFHKEEIDRIHIAGRAVYCLSKIK